MKATKNIERFAKQYEQSYQFLYTNSEIEEKLNLVGLGDFYLKGRFNQLATKLAEFRNDLFSSDREVAAFALAILRSYHINPIFTNSVEQQQETKNKEFIIGNYYYMNSICDSDCKWYYKVLSRTKSTVKLQEVRSELNPTHAEPITRRIIIEQGQEGTYEICRPLGNYSMAPVLTATKIYSK